MASDAIPVMRLHRFIGSPDPAPAFADYLQGNVGNGMEVKVSLRSNIRKPRMSQLGHSRRSGVDCESACPPIPDILGVPFIRREVPLPEVALFIR
jgi:hypothetical protein